jgi:peptide/nickel transport system substrate-binding protein
VISFLRPAALGIAAALVCGVACAPPSQPATAGGVVRAGFYTEPQTLSLLGKTDANSEIIARLVTDSLVQYDARLELQPMLATAWEVSPDGKTVTFHLRRGVRWHDGAPVTARDVVFSVTKARDPATDAKSLMSSFQDLLRVEAIDDHTVVAEYRTPYADFLEGWTVPIIPEHLAGAEPDLLASEFARHPIGCGPFKFARHDPGREIALESNPDYWGGEPEIDGITFSIVHDESTAYQAVLRGDLDVIGVPPDIWGEARRSPDAERLARFVYYRLAVWYVAWNENGKLFGDPGVRRAMLLALDREPFIENVLQGLGRPAATTYHPDSVWADPEIAPLPYDPEEAGRLLDAAGWRDRDGDGVREKDGRPFAFTLTMPASTQEIMSRIAAWMRHSLAQVGVRMEIDSLEWGAFLERRNAGQFDAVMAMLTFSPIPDQHELYHSSSAEGGFNFFGLSDPEIDRLLDRGRESFDREERLEIYSALQHRLVELQPLGCLFHLASPVLHDPRLQGLQPSPIDFWRVTPGPRAWRWEGAPAGS